MGIHVEQFYPNLDLIVRHCSSSRVELVFDAFFSVVASPLEPECQCIVLPPSARGSSFVLSNVRNSSSKDDSKLSVRLRNWFAFLWGQFVIWEPKLAYCWLLNDDPIEQKRSSVGISQKKLRQVAVSLHLHWSLNC